MAVDTRQRRMSMLNFGSGQVWYTLFEADAGAVEADDRLHLLDLYSGLAAEVPSDDLTFIIATDGDTDIIDGEPGEDARTISRVIVDGVQTDVDM